MSTDTHRDTDGAPRPPDDDEVFGYNDPAFDPEPTAAETTGNVRRPTPPADADVLPDDAAPADKKKGKDSAAKSTGPSKVEERMIPGGPVALTAAAAGLLVVGGAAQAGAEVGGTTGAIVGGGLAAAAIAAGAMSARNRRRRSNRSRSKADRRSATRAGMSAAQSGGSTGGRAARRAAAAAADGTSTRPALGGKIRRNGRSLSSDPVTGAGSGGMAPKSKRTLGERSKAIKTKAGKKARAVRAAHGSGTGIFGGAPAGRRAGGGAGIFGGTSAGRRAGGGGGRGSSFGGLGGGRGRGASSRTHGAGSGPAAKSGRRGRHAGGRGSAGRGSGQGSTAGTPRTRTGRAASTAGRLASAPFKAAGAGFAGARKGGSPVQAAKAARRRALKDHKARTGAGKRTRHPFRGWGSAAAGAGAYAGGRAWKATVRMWKWNPWDEDDRAQAAAQAQAAQQAQQAQQAQAAKPKPRKTTSTPDPAKSAAKPSKPVPTPTPSQPAPIQPPASPRPTSGGKTVSVPTINQLIALSEEIRRAATQRAAPGARGGLLEIHEDSKGWAIIMENVAAAAKVETEAWHRYPVHPSIPSMYDAVMQTSANAARAMAGIPGTIDRIERENLERLRNPRGQNAQMLDHTANGYRAGQG